MFPATSRLLALVGIFPDYDIPAIGVKGLPRNGVVAARSSPAKALTLALDPGGAIGNVAK